VTVRLAGLLVVAALLPRHGSAQSVAAQPVATVASNHADWFGYYRLARRAELNGLQPENPDDKALDAAINARLQPWALLKLAQTNGAADDTGAICQLDGIFRIPIRGGGFLWLPAGNRILFVSSAIYSAGVRRVYLDREHPKYPVPSWLGHSIGRWDGDVFVVDTVGFNDKSWLTSSMQPHTENLHVVERYRMASKGLIEVRASVDDRQAFTAPYTYSRYYKLVGTEVPENVCNPEPGDQRMWAEFREKALKDGMRAPAPK